MHKLCSAIGSVNRDSSKPGPSSEQNTNKNPFEKSKPPTSRVPQNFAAQNNTTSSSTFACYGCGLSGYVRANCPNCTKSVETSSLDFCSFGAKKGTSISPRPRPYVSISILGLNGTGIVDTAAKQSVAGLSLYNALKAKGQDFQKENVFIKLADGAGKLENVLVTHVDVILQGRTITTSFIVLPNAENNTLLGIDFIEDAKMVLDISNRFWNFADCPDSKYNLSFEALPACSESNTQIELSSFDNLRADEDDNLSTINNIDQTLNADEIDSTDNDSNNIHEGPNLNDFDEFISNKAKKIRKCNKNSEFDLIEVVPEDDPIPNIDSDYNVLEHPTEQNFPENIIEHQVDPMACSNINKYQTDDQTIVSDNNGEAAGNKNAKNPGILPFKLGIARIRTSTHTFGADRNEIFAIETQYNQVLKAINDGLSHPYFYALQNFNSAIRFQINLVKQKLISVNPISRPKRGLISGLGAIIKSISGNLDQDDADKFNKAIHTLEKNQNQIVDKVNQQISLSTRIIDNFNKTIKLVLHNQEVIANGIESIRKDLNKFIFDFNDYLQVKDILDQVSISLNILTELLSDIENAISFAKLNTLHHSIIKISELEFFPLDHFSYYHLYSIPTPNHTIIIPSNTYLAMSENFYQYQATTCKRIDSEYYCPQGLLIDGYLENDCLFYILKLNGAESTCIQFLVIITDTIIEQITESYYIGVFPNKTKIQTSCAEIDFTVLQGTYLINLPSECSFRTPEYVYINEMNSIKGQPFILPEIQTTKITVNPTKKTEGRRYPT
ncbi:hypothetical protein NQ317_014546 [Molorchus minor]|uniref:Uncharacterized protein n=1 Tax=Molorchus minor TaxID=1323400 RepID=A0ABQ9JK62_9CUCU|nr:hypothetical protein NQ317_014546 [Molorchus minor]